MNPFSRNDLRGVSALVFAAVLTAPQASFAQGSDDLWEINTKMEMQGMSMPGQSVKICVGKNAKDDEFIPRQGDCKIVDSKRTGNKYTYKMACAGAEPTTVDGEVVWGTGAYEGKMKVTMTKTKESMHMSYTGQRISSCVANKK
jgi:hypothetical protein